MSKRWRYFISTLLSMVGFYLYLWLPVESRYYGLALEIGLVVFCFWFGLGVIFENNIDEKLMVIILPLIFATGYSLFCALLPTNQFYMIVLSAFFAFVIYSLFLVENVFLVAIGFKTVPLYRAAYTTSLIFTLFSAFFVFNSILSFRWPFYINFLVTGMVSIILFLYQFWAIAIELPDDGIKKSKWTYATVAGFMMGELALIFSFWPVGVFKGSIYLVSAIYILSGLFQADIKDRLFRSVIMNYGLVGAAVTLAIILTNNWG
ncbi:MAG: hypothetical protein WC069_01100 [Candidatus Shapirobacteria bacterium]